MVCVMTSMDHADRVDKDRVNTSLYCKVENGVRKAMSLWGSEGEKHAESVSFWMPQIVRS